MYENHLGEGYHDEIRKILQVDDVVLPDRIIDADLHIGALLEIIKDRLTIKPILKMLEMTDNTLEKVHGAARLLLAGIICSALKSRTAVPPFLKYKKNWNKKQEKLIRRYEFAMREIEQGGVN